MWRIGRLEGDRFGQLSCDTCRLGERNGLGQRYLEEYRNAANQANQGRGAQQCSNNLGSDAHQAISTLGTAMYMPNPVER